MSGLQPPDLNLLTLGKVGQGSTVMAPPSQRNLSATENQDDKVEQDLKQYQYISSPGYNAIGEPELGLPHPSWEFNHPAEVLHAVHKDPRIAAVVKVVGFYPSDGLHEKWLESPKEVDEGWEEDFYGDAVTKAKYWEARNVVVQQLATLGFDASEHAKWKAALDIGKQSAILAVLLTMLPNIESLHLLGGGGMYKSYLDRIFQYAGSNPSCGILSKLNKLYVTWDDSENGEAVDIIDELILLPSLVTFESKMLGQHENYYECLQTKYGEPRTSNVREVRITWSQLSHYDIAEILKPMLKLEKFDCEEPQIDWNMDCFEGDEEDFVGRFRREFDEVAGEMLQERDLIYKVNETELMIRKRHDAKDLDSFDENKLSETSISRTVEVLEDGTKQHTVKFG
ncbi:hypothetical protein H2200_004698 [Cladophialophora chaetospira]|uniref:Uncharacterized protein n=1 Tax=Cladophialophora chaetospira TaxID=386627 RepID=A0AA38XDT3_9EURO|nr:hypothetical protein H2200_004698 [Cladophialophora chaetospira]